MLRHRLDPGLCLRVLRDRPHRLQARFNENAEALCVSDVVCYEPMYGAERSDVLPRSRPEVELFAGRVLVLPYDSQGAAHTARIWADLERWSCAMGPYDSIVPVQARSWGLVVVTSNVGQYQRVQERRFENWTQ